MPMYDRRCDDGHILIDCLEPITHPNPPCPTCGLTTTRTWIGSGASVISDDIPGGVLIYHGICNADGSPRRYYSKSDMTKEAKRRGLVNLVEHKVDPKTGSDKSKHTTRWI